MTLVQQIKATLAPLAAGGAHYGQNFVEPTVYPFITFLFVSSATNISLGGPSDMQSARVQVDAFSRSVAEARSIAAAVQAALVAGFTVGAIDAQDFPPDNDTKAFRSSADFSIWSTAQ